MDAWDKGHQKEALMRSPLQIPISSRLSQRQQPQLYDYFGYELKISVSFIYIRL